VSFSLRLADPQAPAPIDTEPSSAWRTEAGEITITFHRLQSRFLVREKDCAEYAIDFAKRTVVWTPWPGTNPDLVQGAYPRDFGQLPKMVEGITEHLRKICE